MKLYFTNVLFLFFVSKTNFKLNTHQLHPTLADLLNEMNERADRQSGCGAGGAVQSSVFKKAGAEGKQNRVK